MATPEEITQEAALALYDDDTLTALLTEGPNSRTLPLVYSHFLAAIERALREVPIPTGISPERLAEIDGLITAVNDAVEVDASILLPDQVREVRDAFADLRDHIDHLHRMMNSPEGEAIAAAYEHGKRAGMAVQ